MVERFLNTKFGAPPVTLGVPETHTTQKSPSFRKSLLWIGIKANTLLNRFWRGLF